MQKQGFSSTQKIGFCEHIAGVGPVFPANQNRGSLFQFNLPEYGSGQMEGDVGYVWKILLYPPEEAGQSANPVLHVL